MATSRDGCRPGNEAAADRVWYFDEDGSLAEVDRVPRLQEWLGIGYALVGLALGSLAWLGSPDRPMRGAHRAHPGARHVV
jgi:hypothetical protein